MASRIPKEIGHADPLCRREKRKGRERGKRWRSGLRNPHLAMRCATGYVIVDGWTPNMGGQRGAHGDWCNADFLLLHGDPFTQTPCHCQKGTVLVPFGTRTCKAMEPLLTEH